MDVQHAIVATAAALAALYAGRSLWRQLRQPDDEARGCNACPVNEARRGDSEPRP